MAKPKRDKRAQGRQQSAWPEVGFRAAGLLAVGAERVFFRSSPRAEDRAGFDRPAHNPAHPQAADLCVELLTPALESARTQAVEMGLPRLLEQYYAVGWRRKARQVLAGFLLRVAIPALEEGDHDDEIRGLVALWWFDEAEPQTDAEKPDTAPMVNATTGYKDLDLPKKDLVELGFDPAGRYEEPPAEPAEGMAVGLRVALFRAKDVDCGEWARGLLGRAVAGGIALDASEGALVAEVLGLRVDGASVDTPEEPADRWSGPPISYAKVAERLSYPVPAAPSGNAFGKMIRNVKPSDFYWGLRCDGPARTKDNRLREDAVEYYAELTRSSVESAKAQATEEMVRAREAKRAAEGIPKSAVFDEGMRRMELGGE